MLKMCPRCPEGQRHKPMSEFYNNKASPDGKQGFCKECYREYKKDWQLKRKREDGDDNCSDDEPEEPATSETADDLYVMQNSRISDEVKIGRSINPETRRRSLQASQNYRMDILAVFPGVGHLEPLVHGMLAYCRVLDVPGREWFKCSPQTAFGAIGLAFREQPFQKSTGVDVHP